MADSPRRSAPASSMASAVAEGPDPARGLHRARPPTASRMVRDRLRRWPRPTGGSRWRSSRSRPRRRPRPRSASAAPAATTGRTPRSPSAPRPAPRPGPRPRRRATVARSPSAAAAEVRPPCPPPTRPGPPPRRPRRPWCGTATPRGGTRPPSRPAGGRPPSPRTKRDHGRLHAHRGAPQRHRLGRHQLHVGPGGLRTQDGVVDPGREPGAVTSSRSVMPPRRPRPATRRSRA